VEMLGGTIWAESPAPGRASGSRFAFQIPVSAGEELGLLQRETLC
jgi:signal transduction histidine kinase